MPVNGAVIRDIKEVRLFVLAGRACFTLKSIKTGKHLIYKIIKTKKQNAMIGKTFFVKAKNSQNQYLYFAHIKEIETTDSINTINYWHADNAQVERKDILSRGFYWFMRHLFSTGASKIEQVEFWHNGNCGRCGKPLTDPKSISRGFGPHCYKLTAKNTRVRTNRVGLGSGVLKPVDEGKTPMKKVLF